MTTQRIVHLSPSVSQSCDSLVFFHQDILTLLIYEVCFFLIWIAIVNVQGSCFSFYHFDEVSHITQPSTVRGCWGEICAPHLFERFMSSPCISKVPENPCIICLWQRLLQLRLLRRRLPRLRQPHQSSPFLRCRCPARHSRGCCYFTHCFVCHQYLSVVPLNSARLRARVWCNSNSFLSLVCHGS